MGFLGGLGARPIRLPLEAIMELVEDQLIPEIKMNLQWIQNEGRGDEELGERVLASAWFAINTVRGESLTFRVQVSSKLPPQATDRPVVGGGWAPTIPAAVVFINGRLSPDKILKPSGWRDLMQPISSCTSEYCLPYGIYSVLTHEFTHAADVIGKVGYSAGAVQQETQAESALYRQYLNDPGEVRAFMRQVVDEAVRMGKIVGKRYAKRQQELVQMVLKLSSTWSDISPYLEPSNRRLMLKAVYDGLAREGLVG